MPGTACSARFSSSASRHDWRQPSPRRAMASSSLAEPRYREYLSIARAGGARPKSLLTWRRWTVDALGGTLLARNAAITEALDYGTALAFQAKVHLAVAGASALGLFALAAGALLVLMRRLVLPVQRLTAAVTRLASGDVAAVVPERGRHDEIGAMAAAIEVFRENAVALRQTNMRFDAALSNMSQGLAMYDAEERLVVSNARLCEVEGVPPGSLRIGMTLREILAVFASVGHFPGRTLDEVYAERRGLWAANKASVSFDEARGDRLVSVSIRSLTDDGGCLFTIEDITERTAARRGTAAKPRRALRWLRKLRALASGIGTWPPTSWFGTPGCTSFMASASKISVAPTMHGKRVCTQRTGPGAMPPSPLQSMGSRTSTSSSVSCGPTVRCTTLRLMHLVQRAADGRATRMIGVNWDITERERATQTIRLQAEQYATMLATTSDGFWLLDRDGRFLTVNEAYCRMTGYSREELLKLGIGDIEACRIGQGDRHHMATIVETGFDRFESQHRRKDGAVIDVEGSVSFWRATGQFLCFARDITNKKRTEEQIARMARYDSLTGLANRRVFVEALEQAIATGAPGLHELRGIVSRSRSFQGCQRHARPSRRRCLAYRGGRAASGERSRSRHGRPVRRRRVCHHPQRYCRAGKRGGRFRDGFLAQSVSQRSSRRT